MLSHLSAKAQNDTLICYLKTTTLSETKKNEVFVDSKDSADFYRVFTGPDKNVNAKLFIVNDFYKNGRPKLVGTTAEIKNYIIDPLYNLLFEKTCVEFFPNGHRKSIKNFEHGKLTGDVVTYFPNGKLYLSGTYENDHLHIKECRDSTGKILVENGNGHCIKYDDDFKYIFAEGNIVNGMEEGEWQGKLHNSATYTCMYEKGVIKKGLSYYQGNTYSFTSLEVDAAFNGGIEAFYKFLARTIHYPMEAKEANVQGKVWFSFFVNKNGQLSDFKILTGIGYGCNEEVLRIIKASPPWLPAYDHGIPYGSTYLMPVSFTITKEY